MPLLLKPTKPLSLELYEQENPLAALQQASGALSSPHQCGAFSFGKRNRKWGKKDPGRKT